MITIICCYNNREQLEAMLMQSIYSFLSKNEFNIIHINSRERGFKSAAQAYNTTIKENWENLHEKVLFCHQDIAFSNNAFINRIIEELKDNPMQIIGVAGISTNGIVYSNLKYQRTKEYITKNRVTENKQEVVSVDECCFATSKEVLKQIKFDEANCYHWHLYAVDMCHQAKLLDIPSYVIPESIFHKENSDNGLYTDSHFLKTMWRLTKKYRGKIRTIYSPCYISPTNPLMALPKLARTAIKNFLTK